MSLTIPDEIIESTKMSIPELSQEIAIMLYQKDKLTIGQASRLANMSQLQFQHLVSSRKIYIHYDENDLERDIQTLKELVRL
ncbi:UPF0175 family protein [candidate division KSB1 bacterium]|nr:UPF0175 family protein [candidate division KSB1 bacterium]